MTMASLADVFAEKERTNWLKAWLAVDIAKTGLEHFVDNEAQNVQKRFYSAVNSTLQSSTSTCTGCNTANLLKCPTSGICNKRGSNTLCKSMHDTPAKQPQACPLQICDKIRDLILKEHRFNSCSWKNTSAKFWLLNHWEIAKCYFPPDGYASKCSVQDTDLNGVISFMLNCKHFDNMFSFTIAPSKPAPPCLLTKAREIGKTVRHSSQCKITDTDLQDIFTTLTSLLTDPTCLANDKSSKDAVLKLQKLEQDMFKLSSEEMIHLLKSAQDTLTKVDQVEQLLTEMRVYMENCREHLNTYTVECKTDIDKHAGKCKDNFDQLTRTAAGYEQSCGELIRGLKGLYNNQFSHVAASPLNDSVVENIDDIYMPPKVIIMCKDKGSFQKTNSQVVQYKDLLVTNGKENRRIFIQGEAGSGKTTFAAKLVLDWCGNKSPDHTLNGETAQSIHLITPNNNSRLFDDITALKGFQFIFYLTLRDSVQKYDVTEMIKDQIIDMIYSKEDREKAYILLNEILKLERCLIVLDGLDEWTGPGGKHVLPYLVASHSQCVVLTTTRPWKLSNAQIKHSDIDILLELEGVNDPFEMSRKILGCRDDCKTRTNLDMKQQSFESYIRNNDLEELLFSPMLLSLIVCMWAEGTELKGSKCEIYSLLLESLLKKVNKKEGSFHTPPFRCFKDTLFIEPNIEHIRRLSEVAFKLLFSDKRENCLVFSVNELNRHMLDQDGRKEFALKAGILSESKIASALRASSSFSFIHKSVQEFLAALHIATNTNVITEVISGYLFNYADACLDIYLVFIFLCGLNISAANKLSVLMNERYVAFDYEYNQNDQETFQRIIMTGYREALVNEQTNIQLNLSHFNFSRYNWNDIHRIWLRNTAPILSIDVYDVAITLQSQDSSSALYEDPSQLSVVQRFDTDQPGSSIHQSQAARSHSGHIESVDRSMGFSLQISSTNVKTIKRLSLRCPCEGLDLSIFENLEYIGISADVKLLPKPLRNPNKLTRCALYNFDLTSLDCKKWFLLTNFDFTPLENSVPVIRSIKRIELFSVTCTSTWLRGMFNTLLTLGKRVVCALGGCYIKSSIHDEGKQTYTNACIAADLNNTFEIPSIKNDSPGLWEALNGLNVSSLRCTLKGFRVDHASSLSQALSSLIRLEKLTIYFTTCIDIQLPQSLNNLNFYCDAVSPSQLRDLVNKLSVCTVMCRLEFGCINRTYDDVFPFEHIHSIPKEEYILVLQQLDELEHFKVNRFRIYEKVGETSLDSASVWSTHDMVYEDGDGQDTFDEEEYERFVGRMNISGFNHISMRLQINNCKNPSAAL